MESGPAAAKHVDAEASVRVRGGLDNESENPRAEGSVPAVFRSTKTMPAAHRSSGLLLSFEGGEVVDG